MECKFTTLKSGRIYCKAHNQSLIFLFSNGIKICQVGEEKEVKKLNGLNNYLRWINTTGGTS